ncbi:sigma-70 family RNA polymerase sigma factor [Clostridium sp. JS66]|uniref:sigma-70 family RNA polymerase sigma factor n=1 Tax=Clostridium sp. JS66 TaxID=3064705 RepID=UPI00298E9ACB|nr:sigma-70 family RNA polymerase sigma factor [Clostridium sp. JS66]WPC42340.1 sigma-70 family RNA polymerase sigma factor [Clostridium sp. JS66]
MEELYCLVKESKEQNKDSLMKIIEMFKPLIKKYSRKLSYDGAETDLLITFIETVLFLPIFKNENLKKDKCIVGYIHSSIKNKYIYLSKKNMNILKTETELNLDICQNEFSSSIEDSFLMKYLVDNLNELQKKVIIQKFFYNYSDIEIGKKLKISRQAVNRIKKRALNNLRKEFVSSL